MLSAWRITKKRHAPFDGTGAMLAGARWNSPGHPVIYGSDSFAGAILEILAHTLRPRTLAGAYHAIRIDIADHLMEELSAGAVPGWDAKFSPQAVRFGDAWLGEQRTVALAVPALPARPIGRSVLINPLHPDLTAITVSEPFDVPWDERLF